MGIAIRSGAARVVASGTVTTFGGQSLIFDLVLSRRVGVELVFKTDDSAAGSSVESEAVAGGYRLALVNFDGTDGRGSSRPVLLGEDGDDLLFFHFRVMRFGMTEDRTVFYTFYRAGKAEVGWRPVVDGEAPG